MSSSKQGGPTRAAKNAVTPRSSSHARTKRERKRDDALGFRPMFTAKEREASADRQLGAKMGKSHRRPRRGSTESARAKVSIAVDPDSHAWMEKEAARRQMSVSALYAVAVQLLQRDAAYGRLFELVGLDGVSKEGIAAIEAEWREAGIIP